MKPCMLDLYFTSYAFSEFARANLKVESVVTIFPLDDSGDSYTSRKCKRIREQIRLFIVSCTLRNPLTLAF